jgi:hypothetical protein
LQVSEHPALIDQVQDQSLVKIIPVESKYATRWVLEVVGNQSRIEFSKKFLHSGKVERNL